jgi:site-specific DNA recombinase
MKKRAALYARVSTDEQAEHGYSLGSQLVACRKYADEHGMIVVAEFQDDFSGAKLERPGFAQMRDMIRTRAVDCIIVLSSDRLTRNLAHSLILREELKQHGVERHYVRRGKTEDTPEARMLDNMEGVFDEYWREKIAEATRRNMRRKAESGRFTATCKAPYGYRHVDGRLVIHEPEADVVRRIYTWYVHGDDSGKRLTLMAIQRRLDELRIPKPSDSAGTKHRRKSRVWCVSAIQNILSSETYIGVWRFGKSIGGNGREGKRPIEEQIAVSVPAVLDDQLWQAAQELRRRNKELSRRNAKQNYLLSGYVFCGLCEQLGYPNKRMHGQSMHGGISNRKDLYLYYKCRGSEHHYGQTRERCGQRHVRTEVLDGAVWRFILEVMESAADLEQLLRAAQMKEAEQQTPMRDELATVNRLLAERGREAANLAAQLGEYDRGAVGNALRERVKALDKEHAALEERQRELQSQLDSSAMSEVDIQAALNFRADVQGGLSNANFDMKREMLRLLRARVTVTGRQAKVVLALPGCDRSIDFETGSYTGCSKSPSAPASLCACRAR